MSRYGDRSSSGFGASHRREWVVSSGRGLGPKPLEWVVGSGR